MYNIRVARLGALLTQSTERRNNGVSPSGKATDSDSVIRAFESLYPSHQNLRFHLRFFAFYGVLSKCRKRLNIPQNGETFGESFRSEFLLFELVSN